MGTCAPKPTSFDQKRADFSNLGARNSTVTFFFVVVVVVVEMRPLKAITKAIKITTALLQSNSSPGQSRPVHVR